MPENLAVTETHGVDEYFNHSADIDTKLIARQPGLTYYAQHYTLNAARVKQPITTHDAASVHLVEYSSTDPYRHDQRDLRK
jgi:hypothetical protein